MGNGRINSIGDYTREWLNYIPKWKAENPPLDNGCYLCGICGRWVLADEVTLDHIEKRTKSNLLDPKNIQPAHYRCNQWKGSRPIPPVVTIEVYEFVYFLSNM